MPGKAPEMQKLLSLPGADHLLGILVILCNGEVAVKCILLLGLFYSSTLIKVGKVWVLLNINNGSVLFTYPISYDSVTVNQHGQ